MGPTPSTSEVPRASSLQHGLATADSDEEWDDDDSGSQDEDDDQSDGEDEDDRLSRTFVEAVHSSLVDYLRSPNAAPTSVTSRYLDGNFDLFMACKDIICNGDDVDDPVWTAKVDLAEYAVPSLFWHLQNIDLDAVPDKLLAFIAEGLKELFTNVALVSRSLEYQIEQGYFGFELPLKQEWPGRSVTLRLLEKADQLEEGKLAEDCVKWIKEVLRQPSKLLLPLAKAHVENWLSSDTEDFEPEFECALAALSTVSLDYRQKKIILNLSRRTLCKPCRSQSLMVCRERRMRSCLWRRHFQKVRETPTHTVLSLSHCHVLHVLNPNM